MSKETLQRLGKGLGALMEAQPTDEKETKSVDISLIVPNPDQPRKEFDQDSLEELADSIKEKGIIQPILVEKTGDKYQIIAGERRFRAAKIAGLDKIPITIGRFSAQEKLEIALIENIQRKDLTPVEEALAYESLMQSGNLSQEELAKIVGKKRSTVANSLRLLKLNDEMRTDLSSGAISAGHARAILSVEGKENQQKLFKAIEKKGLSVREAEALAGKYNEEFSEGISPKLDNNQKQTEILDAEQKFMEKLGTKVAIKGSLNKGKLVISYKTAKELQGIFEMLGR